MNNKLIFLLIIVFLGVFLAGCSNKQPSKIEDSIQTFDDLKKVKESGQPVSELDKCIKEAQLVTEKYDNYTRDCERQEVMAKGYNDTIDCIQEFNSPECQNTDRYNAQVDAGNECMTNLPLEIKKGITITDCATLAK